MKAIRSCVTAAAGAALVCGLTACGGTGEGGTPTPHAALKAAALKTTQQNSYRTKRWTKGDGKEPSSREELAFQRKPELDEKKHWRPGSAEASRTLRTPDADYIKKPGAQGGKWVKMDNDLGPVPRRPVDPEIKKRSEGYLPNMIGSLATAKNLEKAGEETVNGRPTTHFKGTVVPLEMEEYKGDVMNGAVRDHFASERKIAHHVKAEIDLWIGEDDLVVKAQEVARTSQGEIRTVEEYSDYGVDPRITIPRGDDVVSFDRVKPESAGKN
ncbi:hypothetical protein [Streptomyces griseocarneus]|uniref:hypothetical protein n=1 Tax=Streptomyces griseocarneus TaxID=51201 RepID=UPI00167F1474|nr:hypothetical protein [Streptomyces griseocarneus]MBZ6473637.1 hypothetical protein [Streptomyces griseocarneus]